MNKFLKIFLIIAGILAVLFIAVVASVPYWFPINTVKGIVVDKMEEKTGRNIDVGELKFNIFIINYGYLIIPDKTPTKGVAINSYGKKNQ